MRAGDVVIVPCQPTLLDLDRVQATLDVATGVGRPAAVLLTRADTRTRAFKDIRAALTGAGVPMLTAAIPSREGQHGIAAAFGTSPNGEGMALYTAVFDEIEEALAS